MADVFVSYAQEDRAWVERLVAAAERAGLDVWYDTRLRPGQSFDEVIASELDAASVVLVVWSAASVKSYWVRDEAQVGANRGVLVPVSADGTMPPLGFRQFQSTDLSSWRGEETPALRLVLEELTARAERTRAVPQPDTQPDMPGTAVPPTAPAALTTAPARRRVGRTRRAVAIGLGAMVTGGALAAWLLLQPGSPPASPSVDTSSAESPAADAQPSDATKAATEQLAAWSCSLLRVRPGPEGGEAVVEGVYGAAHDPAPLAPALATALGRQPVLRAASLPDIFCPVLDALRTHAHGLFVSQWTEPRAEYTVLHDGNDTARAIRLSLPVETLNPDRVVYALLVEADIVETLLIVNNGKFERQTQGDIPKPEPLPADGTFEHVVFRYKEPAPELLLYLELDRRVPALEDALDVLTPSDPATLSKLLNGPDAPVVSAAQLVVLDRGWVYPPGFAAETAPERKVEALYHWLLANRPAWYKAQPLPSPYTFATLAFAPVAVEALYIDAELGDGPFNAAEVLFSDLIPRDGGADGKAFEGQLAIEEVALATNDGLSATVRAIVSRSDPGKPAQRRTIDLTLSRMDGVWLISDARWPDRAASDLIPRGATLRNLLDTFLASQREYEDNQ